MNQVRLGDCAEQVFVTLSSGSAKLQVAIDNSGSKLSARLMRADPRLRSDTVAWAFERQGPSPPGRVFDLVLDSVGDRLRLRACGFAGELLGPKDWMAAYPRLLSCSGAVAEQARSPLLGPPPIAPGPIQGYVQPELPVLIELCSFTGKARPFKLLFERGACLDFSVSQVALSVPGTRSALNFNAPAYQDRSHFALNPQLSPSTALDDVEGTSPIYMLYPSPLGSRIVLLVSPWRQTIFINSGAIAARSKLVEKCLGNVRVMGEGIRLRFGAVAPPRPLLGLSEQ